MLRRRRMLLIVEVMQQPRAPILLRKRVRILPLNPSAPPPARHSSPYTPPPPGSASPATHSSSTPATTPPPLRTKLTHPHRLASLLLTHYRLTTNHCLTCLPPWFHFRFFPAFLPESSAIPLDSSCTRCHSRHIAHLFIGREALRCPALAAARNTQHGN